MLHRKAQGAFEYVLLLGGVLLVIVAVIAVVRSGILAPTNRTVQAGAMQYWQLVNESRWLGTGRTSSAHSLATLAEGTTPSVSDAQPDLTWSYGSPVDPYSVSGELHSPFSFAYQNLAWTQDNETFILSCSMNGVTLESGSHSLFVNATYLNGTPVSRTMSFNVVLPSPSPTPTPTQGPSPSPSPSPCAGTNESCGSPGACQNCSTLSGFPFPTTYFCVGSNQTREYRIYYCLNNSCSYSTTNVTNQTCQYGCSNGTCNSVPPMVPGPWLVGNQSAFNEGSYATTYWNSSGFVDLKASERLRDPSMVLLMHFNNNTAIGENATYAVDESGNENNGTLYNGSSVCGNQAGCPSWKNAIFGKGIGLDGDGDSVQIPASTSLDIRTNLSIAGWVYFTGLGSGASDAIITKENSVNLQYALMRYGRLSGESDRRKFVFCLHTGVWTDYVSDYLLSDGVWYHLVGTYDGTNVKFYVNGQLVKTRPATASSLVGDNKKTRIGRSAYEPWTDAFNGTVDEIAVYNRTLSADEIADLYQYRRGFYQSKVYDAGANASWKNLTWSEAAPYGEELPNNGAVENAAGGANMTGNVLLMHLNENPAINNSVIADYSRIGNNGTLTTNDGSTNKAAAGILGSSLNFDGSDDYVSIPHRSNLDFTTQNLSAEAFVKFNSLSGNQGFIGKCSASPWSGYGYRLESNGIMVHLLGTGVSAFTSALDWSTGRWYHVAFTYDHQNIKIYRDGVLLWTQPSSTDLISNTVPLAVGAFYGSGGELLNGSIDEAAVYNRSLSAAEIMDHYKRGASNLKFQVRSCDDSACSGESFFGPGNNSSAYFTNASFSSLTSLPSNRYFQRKALFETANVNYTPWLYNVTVGYQSP
jgi:hypothetical protein